MSAHQLSQVRAIRLAVQLELVSSNLAQLARRSEHQVWCSLRPIHLRSIQRVVFILFVMQFLAVGT